MGSRGASSGMSDKGKPYGSEYRTLLQSGNIKFVKANEGAATSPMETMTLNRVYVTINERNEAKFISFYDQENKRYKQIDLIGKPHMIDGEPKLPHVHFGYEHRENGDADVSVEDRKLIDRVLKIWQNYLRRQ